MGRLAFNNDVVRAVDQAEVVFNTVGTPPRPDGDVDLSQIYAVIDLVAEALKSYKVIVTMSTVPVGTNRAIVKRLRESGVKSEFDVVSNPEFLREGKTLHDFFHPDRIVIGFESERARAMMSEIFRPLYLIERPFVWCGLETAELIKYASNGFLATKITYINQIANLCEAVGADVHTVAKAIGMDGRIDSKFLHPGPGFGGSCLPKDASALVKMGERYSVEMSVIREVLRANREQPLRISSKLERMLGTLHGRTIAVLGLAYKADTDDARDSRAIAIIEHLVSRGGRIQAHDPKAIENFWMVCSEGVSFFDNEFEALKGADAVVFCTEWNEYRNIDLSRMKHLMRGRNVVDA